VSLVDADAPSWGVVCGGCGAVVNAAVELRDALSDSPSIFEPDVEIDPPVPPLQPSSCFCACVPCCCPLSLHVCPVIPACTCDTSILETCTRLQRLLSTLRSWAPPKPAAATMSLVSAVESARALLPVHSAVMQRLLDACCLALLSADGISEKGYAAVGAMSWEAADILAAITCRASVTEVLLRCRAVKAAAAAADCDRVVAWGGSCVKMAGNVLGNESEAVRLLRVWVRVVCKLVARFSFSRCAGRLRRRCPCARGTARGIEDHTRQMDLE
jgi:hypothetical protein